jgi:hypothetical protein
MQTFFKSKKSVYRINPQVTIQPNPQMAIPLNKAMGFSCATNTILNTHSLKNGNWAVVDSRFTKIQKAIVAMQAQIAIIV